MLRTKALLSLGLVSLMLVLLVSVSHEPLQGAASSYEMVAPHHNLGSLRAAFAALREAREHTFPVARACGPNCDHQKAVLDRYCPDPVTGPCTIKKCEDTDLLKNCIGPTQMGQPCTTCYTHSSENCPGP